MCYRRHVFSNYNHRWWESMIRERESSLALLHIFLLYHQTTSHTKRIQASQDSRDAYTIKTSERETEWKAYSGHKFQPLFWLTFLACSLMRLSYFCYQGPRTDRRADEPGRSPYPIFNSLRNCSSFSAQFVKPYRTPMECFPLNPKTRLSKFHYKCILRHFTTWKCVEWARLWHSDRTIGFTFFFRNRYGRTVCIYADHISGSKSPRVLHWLRSWKLDCLFFHSINRSVLLDIYLVMFIFLCSAANLEFEAS